MASLISSSPEPIGPLSAPQGYVVLPVLPKHLDWNDEKHIAAYYRARQRLRQGWGRALTTRCNKQWDAEKKAVTNAIREARNGTAETAAMNAIWKQLPAWDKLLRGFYTGMATDIAPTILKQHKGSCSAIVLDVKSDDPSLWMQAVRSYLDKTLPDTVNGLLSTTQTRVVDAMRAGLKNGDGIPAIIKSIGDVYDKEFKQVRTTTIVRTELTTATGTATQAVGKYVSDTYQLTISKRWLTARDMNVRDDHRDMEGVQVDINDNFDVHGSAMAFPGDRSQGADPAEYVSCRCDVVQHTED